MAFDGQLIEIIFTNPEVARSGVPEDDIIRPIMDETLRRVERTNQLLDEVERLRKEWERSNPSIESVAQMRIAAKGYISSLEEANRALSECVTGVLEEMEKMQKINEEIARTSEVMAKIAKDMDSRSKGNQT